MDDDDDDTVVGTCLHCNAPPPPRSGSRGSTYSGGAGGGGGGGGPCSSTSNSVMASSTATSSPSACTRVQVSCDDCRSFICDGCHWCHEFQANHEIRVCDRCDAFYCRGCDEMDQCEDCSEVVCNTCSTLMSCKFCGCGLCEDCATACGRCGIVLCARDAKFAVECDTCRMSYCLVCLASGTKDPCVRCGHRPSKRVEQLVHLRLKSIYKAFKQSGASMGPGGGSSGGSGSSSGRGGDGGPNSNNMGGKYSSALRSLTESSSGGDSSSSKDNFSNFDQSMASEVAAVLSSASNAGGGGGPDSRRSRGKRIPSHDHSPTPMRNRSSSRASNAAAERYFRKTQAEMEAAAAAAEAEADAAAAALLAELDEEQATSTATSKKSKKKKKKREKKAAEEQASLDTSTPTADNVKSADDMDDDDKNSNTSQRKKGSKKSPARKSSSMESSSPIDDESSDEEMNFEQLVAGAKGSSRPSKKEKKEEASEEKIVAPPPKPKPEPPPPVVEEKATAPTPAAAATADFDAELAILLSSEDEEGLETLLEKLKGVPGLGAARKTAKKALKKIREARKPPTPVETEKLQTDSQTGKAKAHGPKAETGPKLSKKAAKAAKAKQKAAAAAASATPPTATDATPSASTGTQHQPLLRIVSRTQSNVGAKSGSVAASARAECVMHMSPAVVGWVIGKGGSRIRDMMEESGAKIWIDQESMDAKEARVVYVSGKRSCVDTAVRMVKDIVSQAPASASAAASQSGAVAPTPEPAPVSASSSTGKADLAPAFVAPAPKKAPAAAKSAKEPISFAAAISSGSTTPAAVTPPGPNPLTPTTQPASTQSWALPATEPVVSQPPQVTVQQAAAPQSVQAMPQPTTALDAGGAKLFSHTVTSELGCDPRFVALLIGRRGWTVKNIQAESGADLRIDQTVDPPKIIISGKPENVKRAEEMVRDVLKYPHSQLHQEVQTQPAQQHVGDMQLMPDKPPMANPSPVPMPPNLHRGISSSTPQSLEELHVDSSHRSNNVPAELNSPYTQYQQQQQQQQQRQNPSNVGLYDSSPVMSDFLPNNDQRQSQPSPSMQADQREWGHHNQQAPPPMRNQFPTLPPFPNSQVGNNRDEYNMLSNHNAPPLGPQSPPQDNRRPSSSSFSFPPEQQHVHFPHQRHESAPQAQMPQSQAPRMNDFMGGGGSNHNMNGGWDLPANGNNHMGGNWNQGNNNQPLSHQQQPSFEPQAAPARPPLSNNPFERQGQSHQPANIPGISDDSLMVDNMFASLGASGGDGDGLLSALNSVSLGGATSSQQQGGNNIFGGSKIAGWSAEDSANPFMQQSRLGEYRDER